MVSIWELVDKMTWGTIPEDHRMHLAQLHHRLNVVRFASQMPMVINNDHNKARGYRTHEQHYLIYEKINKQRQEKGLNPVRVPTESKHLFGLAADSYDPDGTHKILISLDPGFHGSVGFWFEHFDATPQWVHWQIVPHARFITTKEIYFMP